MIASLLAAASPGPGCSITAGGRKVIGLCSNTNSLHISVAYRSILPVLVLSLGALLLLIVSSVLPKRSWPGLYASLTAAIGVGSTGVAVWEWYDIGNHPIATLGGQILYDRFSIAFALLVSAATVLGALTSDSYLRREGLDGVEAYVLMLLAGTGAILMAESDGLIMLFLGLEIMSISLYVMAAFHRRRTESGEAGFKYFILGSFSSAIFLYGIALVYGATGSTQLDEIATFLARNSLQNSGVLLAGIALLIVGLGFKVAAVPFHFWTPDVYQGSPTPFTGYMAAVAKAAGFAGLLRVLTEALSSQQSNWRPAIWLMAVLTLLVGSALAIAQKDLKRMLAYSSISQAGYVLIGVQAASASGSSGAVFYLFTYTFIVIGTFAIIGLIQGRGETRNDLGAIRGLARRQPWLAAAMLVLLLAQAGVPFTSGFLAKLYVIQAVLERGQYPLAVIAMLTAAVAAFFYLRVALLMYSGGAEAEPTPVPASPFGPAASASPSAEPFAPGSADSTPRPAPVPAAPTTATAPAPAIPAALATTSSPATLTALGAPSNGAEPDADGAMTAGLQPVPTLDAPGATAALEAPPVGPVEVPWPVAVALGICVVFTIGAGVSQPIIDFARHATAAL